MSSRSSSPLRNSVQIRMRLTKENMLNMQSKLMSEPVIGYKMRFNSIKKILQGDQPLCWLIAPLGILLGSNPDYLVKHLIKNESLEIRGYAIFKNSFGYDIVKFDNCDNCTQSILVNVVKNCGLLNPGLPTTLGLLLDLPCVPMNPRDQTRSSDSLIIAFTFSQIVTFCTNKTSKKLHPNHVYSLIGYTDSQWVLLEPNGTGTPILPKGIVLNSCCNMSDGSFVTLDKNKDDDELSMICIMYNTEMMKRVGITDDPSKKETYILVNSNKQLYNSERPRGVELIHQFNTSSTNPALNFHSYLFKSENGFDLPNSLAKQYRFSNVSENLKYLACKNYEVVSKNENSIKTLAEQKVDVKFRRMLSLLNGNDCNLLFLIKDQLIPSAPEFAASFCYGVFDRFRVYNDNVYLDSWTLRTRFGLAGSLVEISRLLDLEHSDDVFEDLSCIDSEMSLNREQQLAVAEIYDYYDDIISSFSTKDMRISKAFSKKPVQLSIKEEDRLNLSKNFLSSFESTEVYSGMREVVNKAKEKFIKWKNDRTKFMLDSK